MLSISILFTLLALVWSQNSTTTNSGDGSGIFQVEVYTNNIGRIKYEDGEVILSQNQRKETDVFFTPFPRVDPVNTECRENLLSDHIELVLSVKLYTSKLVEEVNAYLKQRFSTLCTTDKPCDVSLIPMNAIRLVQKGLRTNKAREMYTVNDEWYSNTLLLQSIEFIIYTANKSVCETLRSSIAGRCHLSNFEVQYSLHSEKTVERQMEITTEQVTSTSMFNEIRSQFPKSDTVALTGNDFKQLISEVMDKITIKIRIQEGFDSKLQDPIKLDRLIERQLQIKQVHLEQLNDRLWESLYWTNDLTRPDRLTKAISTIIRKNSTDANHFLYDTQAAKNIHKLGLTQHDIDQFEQLDKQMTDQARSSSSSGFRASGGRAGVRFNFKAFPIGVSGGGNSRSQLRQSGSTRFTNDSTYHKQDDKHRLNATNILSENDTYYVLSRNDVENYLGELSDHIHLEGDFILPKPVDVHLIKLNTLRAETKLVSHSIFVRTRSNIHTLPLRCPSKGSNKTAIQTLYELYLFEDKVSTMSKNFADQLAEMRQQTSEQFTQLTEKVNGLVYEQKQLEDRIANQTELENRITPIEQKWTGKIDTIIHKQAQLASRSSNLTHLESKVLKMESEIWTQINGLKKQFTSIEANAVKNRMNCQSGKVQTEVCRWKNCSFARQLTYTVSFQPTFDRTPTFVHVSLSSFDFDHGRNSRINVTEHDITPHGFKILFYSWHNTIMFSASINWIACS